MRVAFLAATLFLGNIDFEITAGDEAVVIAMLSLAEGSMDERNFAALLQDNAAASGEANSLGRLISPRATSIV